MPALQTLKALDLGDAIVSLWVFKRSTGGDGNPKFIGRWVETTNNLDAAMKEAVAFERDRIEEVQEYGLLAQNNEASGLVITTLETHAGLVAEQAAAEVAAKKVLKLKDIQNSVFYATKLVVGDQAFFAVRKTDPSWRAKKAQDMISVFFSDNKLDLDPDPGFNVSKSIDFFIVGDEVLISNKGNFESVLSYKQAHRDDFAALQGEAEFQAIFANTQPLVGYIADNKIQLRRAAAIRQKGHYRSAGFMQNLRGHHTEYGLNIQFDAQGRIVPSPETCRDIVQALLDHRLVSGFSHNIYDVQDATNIQIQ